MIFVKTQAEQEQIDELLTRHVNWIIRSIFEKKLKGMAFDDVREVIPKDEVFCRKVRNYLPKSYPADLTGEAFLSAYYMMKSESVYMPDIITAYVINAVLNKEIGERKTLGISLREPAVECDGMLDQLSEVMVETPEEAENILKNIQCLREQQRVCEDISRYPELCGLMDDPVYLDIMSEKRLKYMIKTHDKSDYYATRVATWQKKVIHTHE